MRKLIITLLVSTALALAADTSAIAIRNARIVTASGPAIANGTVVIRDGLIDAVGSSVEPPPGAWIIDGQGLTVYPGLIDALSTLGIPPPPAAPSATPPAASGGGRTAALLAASPAPQIRGPEDRPLTTSWVNASDQISPSDRRIDTFRSAGFTSAVTFPTTGIFAGQGAIINLAGEKPGQMVVAGPAGQYISTRTSRGGESGMGTFPGSLFGVIAYIRQIYLDADHYKLVKDAYAKNPRGMARPDYDRALEGVIASPRILLPASREVEIVRMTKFANELKQPAILYGGHEAYKMPGNVKLPLLVSLKWPEKARDGDPEEIDSYRTLEVRDNAPSTAAALTKAGAKWAFYSDGIDKPADLMKAVKKAIDAGLSPDDAVRALTLSPAEIFGVADRLGSIEKGKIANLIVTKGDLFQDKTQVQYIFIDGQKFAPTPEDTPAPGGAGAGANRPPAGGNQ